MMKTSLGKLFLTLHSFYSIVSFFFLGGGGGEEGWQWGKAGPKDGVFASAPHGFVLPHPCPAPHDGENFLAPS